MLTAGAVALALCAGAWLINDGSTGSAPPQPGPSADTGTPSAGADPGGSRVPAAPPLPASPPVRMRIPAIKVDAPVTDVGLDDQDHLASPPMDNRNLVGWYRQGPTPGAAGNALTVGHVDNHSGPTVFYRLGLLRRGDTIEVVRRDRKTAVFTVDSVRLFPKDAVPTDLVYGPTDRAELHVITCGGTYDRKTGYQSNVVVFSHLTAAR
ncbi:MULTISPECIES: class F sortase [Kitasatospora]|uniref:Class F sortase n=2 Tax=Kitasatospora TaxID=2063 RepID=A0ABT1J7T7_9ACTN|nr:class F sortase [Kitasatospora paracochleata]MCP2313500.1 hypothetical protein [Kitasatospora paracochleata]